MSDFGFLAGRLRVRHRRKAVTSLSADLDATREAGWWEFEGVNTGTPHLGGRVVVDELEAVLPDGRAIGFVDVHAHDPATGLWTNVIHGDAPDWAPYTGRFTDGVGVFERREGDLYVRHTWDEIGPAGARFRQAFSTDGRTWETNWLMRLTRG